MSTRIAISCPDHVYKLLSGLAELQSRPMSKVVVELLVASYPALSHTYQLMLRLRAEQARAEQSLPSGVDSIMTDFRDSMRDLIAEAQTDLELPLTVEGKTE